MVIHTLKQIAGELLDPHSSLHTWIPAVNALNKLLNQYSPFGVDPYTDIGKGETRLSCGVAISPIKAALCAHEISRTAAFIKGLGRAIQGILSQYPGYPARI